MFSLKMVTFFKGTNCPASQNLLAFQNGASSDEREMMQIQAHLAECEFCASEVDFYAHYPPQQTEEKIAEVEIPLPLYELAEALLSNKHKDLFLLNKLLNETEGVKI